MSGVTIVSTTGDAVTIVQGVENAGPPGPAVIDASYLVLATNTTLTAERVLTAGTGIDFTDAGAGSTLTVDVDPSEFGNGTVPIASLASTPLLAANNLSDVTAATARTNLGLGGLAVLSAVGSAEITNGAIVNDDINASAAIALSKLANIATARLLGRTTAGSGAIEELASADSFVSAASDTTAGKVELATAAETTTGTDATRAVTPDGLAGSEFGVKLIEIMASDMSTAITTGDGKAGFMVPASMNGMNLIRAHAALLAAQSTSGTPTIQIRNATQAADMLSTRITIDANESTSHTAATAPVVDTANDDVATGDLIYVDVDVAGTGAKGLLVTLEFQLP